MMFVPLVLLTLLGIHIAVYCILCPLRAQDIFNQCVNTRYEPRGKKLCLCSPTSDDKVAAVSSDSCSRHCSHSSHPVCGTDGNTYRNQCYLDKAICTAQKHQVTVGLSHNGSCISMDQVTSFDCDVVCDDEGQQQYCASNGVTYASMCEVKNADCVASRHKHHVSVLHPGPCLTLNGSCAGYNASCPNIIDYKCGTTGYTYTNECHLKQAQCRQIATGSVTPVSLLHDGKCGYASTNQSRNVNCTQYADMSLVGIALEGMSVKISAHCSHYHGYICVDGIEYSSDCYLCYRFALARKISYQNMTIPISHDGKCHYQAIIG